MSAFSDSNFASGSYSSYRPTYNKEFFDHVFGKYVPKDGGALAVDIGCGTGQVTAELASHFRRVIGTDLSAKMVETATEKNTNPAVEYKVSGAESIPFVSSGTVDLVTCGQACHWFDHKRWFEEMHRILADNGLLVYFGYADPYFPKENPAVNELLDQIGYGDDWLGKYWEQPGRNIVRNLLQQVNDRLPADKFQLLEYASYDGIARPTRIPLHIERHIQFGDFLNYVTTWSSLHNYYKHHPAVKNTPEDPVNRIFRVYNERFGWSMNKELTIVWKTCYTIARKL